MPKRAHQSIFCETISTDITGETQQPNTKLGILPGSLIGEILSYLCRSDIHSSLILNQHIYQELRSSKALEHLIFQQQLREFCNLIAIEGEDNQNKAEAILIASKPEARAQLLFSRTQIKDAAGRHFKEISAYGYAFWSGDTRMRQMMAQYIGEDSIAAYMECRQVTDQGVCFSFQGEYITNSKYFAFQFLLKAYQDFLNEVARENDEDEPIDELWLNIAKEQAKLPLHLVQEYCSEEPFDGGNQFINLDINRTIKFYHWFSRSWHSWFNANDDTTQQTRYPMRKGWIGSALQDPWWRVAGFERAQSDLRAMTALCEARFVNDFKETLETLQTKVPARTLGP